MQKTSHRHAGTAVLVSLTISIFAFESAVHANDDTAVSILYYESIRLIETPDNDRQQAISATTGSLPTLEFDAYGRRFMLHIEATQAVAGTRFSQLSGRLDGIAGSWFKLLRNNDDLNGIIADGSDTYFVAPRHRVADLLIDTPAADAPPNIVYRLADMLVPVGLLACATGKSTTSPSKQIIDGQTAFTKLSTELQAATSNAAASNSGSLMIGVVADESFTRRYATNAETKAEVAVLFNEVQGIFESAIGIKLIIDTVFPITPDIVDPFTATRVGEDLLEELGRWRSINQADLGHTHMLTRRSLINDDGDRLAGISYLGRPARSGICNPVTGASLSGVFHGLTALIIAHELGHNLGAPHDNDPDDACASTPDLGLIMSSSISQTTATNFSQCSIGEMNKVVVAASCLGGTAQSARANPGGGGGSLGWLSMLVLIITATLRRRSER